MKNRIYKYFFHEFTRYFAVTLFALTAVIWTIQAVNFLDLVTDDGHAFRVYLLYSLLTIPKILTKLIPFSFLIASILTILKFEKDNELIILWSSGLNKIYIVNLLFRISLIIMFLQLVMTSFITPEILNISRTLLKNSKLQFVPSLLKEKQFNDAVEGLTIFVDKKYANKKYENIFIRDDRNVLTKVSSISSTIFAKSGYISKNETSLVLLNGNIQTLKADGKIDIILFEKTTFNLSGLSTKSITEPKVQETSSFQIINCMRTKNNNTRNCDRHHKEGKDTKIEFNKRFGTPIFIPLLALIVSFLLSSRRDKKNSSLYKYTYGFFGVTILIFSEITVRYSGISLNHSAAYYLIPIGLLPLVYFFLLRTFKYENLS